MVSRSKKIGIITIHRINNYGAILQAFALNKYLRDLGYDVETIDFRTKRVAESYELYSTNNSIMDIVRNIQAFLYRKKLCLRISRMNDFVDKKINLSLKDYDSSAELELDNLKYDTYICGSDQIWNTYCDNYEDAFILSFVKQGQKRISYAASLGMSSIHPDYVDLFHDELTKFDALSVREQNAVDIISSVSEKKVKHVVDPVFLLSKEKWCAERNIEYNIKKPYIFFYAVHGELPGMRNYVRKLSKLFGLPIVVVSKNLREMLYSNLKCYDAGPSEFLSLLHDAKYVFTNSFHACAFSIIFQKQFQVYVPYSEGIETSSRIYSLLKSYNLSDRMVDKNGSPFAMDSEINWKDVKNLLYSQVDMSKRFLNDALQFK